MNTESSRFRILQLLALEEGGEKSGLNSPFFSNSGKIWKKLVIFVHRPKITFTPPKLLARPMQNKAFTTFSSNSHFRQIHIFLWFKLSSKVTFFLQFSHCFQNSQMLWWEGCVTIIENVALNTDKNSTFFYFPPKLFWKGDPPPEFAPEFAPELIVNHSQPFPDLTGNTFSFVPSGDV